MVSRIDLDRLRMVHQKVKKQIPYPVQIMLWDSGSVRDLMDPPKAKILFPPHGAIHVMLSYAHVMAGMQEAERMLAKVPPTAGGIHDDDPEEDVTSWFVPEHYYFEINGLVGIEGRMVSVFEKEGLLWQNMSYVGTPWESGEMNWSWSDAVKDAHDKQLGRTHDLKVDVPQDAWNRISADAQSIQWCVMYPEQFPILRDRLAKRVEKMPKRKQRDVKKLALPDIQILELRPTVINNGARKPARPTGQHREYKYQVEVRGHPRHLPSGKITWVTAHTRAKDKPKLDRLTAYKF